jgi:hypothetical protein
MNPRAALSLLTLSLACTAPVRDTAPERPGRASQSPPRAELARLLAEYDRAAGPDRGALARRIDDLAGQRYATWSRLYWHRDLEAAKREARATGRPILSLRMLGRLDQDLSCANSRFFRVALYANRDVSRYLADHFILHWSSERPVPVARIDFGDGRVLERTVGGNSAHYVLDAGGRPVDAIPGLYSPALFLDALEQAQPVAARAASLDDRAFADLVASYHRDQVQRAADRFATLGPVRIAPQGSESLADAEMRAASKAVVERPLVETLQLGVQLSLAQARSWDRASDFWAQVGAAIDARVARGRLDARSRALLSALEPADWARAGQALPAAGVERLIAAFEALMRRDTAYNELVLHQQIHARLASGPVDLAALNRWVYAALFLTPAEDPWLGMATPDTFTGLPRDGMAVSAAF